MYRIVQAFTLIILLFFFQFTLAQSKAFETTNLVDEFGDKIGEVKMNISKGTFSNSVTSNSELIVKTVLDVMPELTLEEFKERMKKELKDQGSSDKKIKSLLKYAKSGYKLNSNINGTISFNLLEYEDIKASMIGVDLGIISIKTSDGEKLSSKLFENSFSNGTVKIIAYKELTSGATGIKNQIKYGFYDWAQSDIYNKIVNAKGTIQVVIAFGNSTYKFSME
jgi:hypothetical protein